MNGKTIVNQAPAKVMPWSPTTWQQKPAAQQPVYDDAQQLESAIAKLTSLPPLVTSWEIDNLRLQLAAAARGEAFLLQGGDCSESLDDCGSESIVRNLKVLMQMSLVLAFSSMKRVVRVGRFAGQYAKPRSSDVETRDGVALPVYRGDIVNRSGFTPEQRRADPELLLKGYERAAMTLNFVRALCSGGFADLHHPENWELGFMSETLATPQFQRYREMVRRIGDSLQFMEAVHGMAINQLNSVEVFSSHEGLLLTYEQAQTRPVPRRTGYFNLSTHFPWIGERTRQLDGAHVEYFRGIKNPIGVKVGASMQPDDLLRLMDVLHPNDEPGRLTLIHRFGADRVATALPPLIQAVKKSGKTVLWCCDPMHGNTISTDDGRKTRVYDTIVKEITEAFAVHRSEGSRLGGIHLELTGDDVTECVGGARGLQAADLGRAYKSNVDPRLNHEQAMEIAFLIADQLAGQDQAKS
jgi:3-deoxy-7-phosphoheptulonate synthase